MQMQASRNTGPVPITHSMPLPDLDLRDDLALPMPARHIGYYALEAKPVYEEAFFTGDDDWWPSLLADEGLFFMHQCMIAVEHLTEVQHCDAETIQYSGVFNGRHVWMARS